MILGHVCWLGCLLCCIQISGISQVATLAHFEDFERAVPFSLRDHQGQLFELNEMQSPLVVVAFMGTECPLAKLYAPRLQKMADQFSGEVQFVFISSNQQDSLAKLAHFVRSQEMSIPFLKDPGNTVADQFQAERTPEVFLLDQRRNIRYRGRIDDQYTYGIQRPQADHLYLLDAIRSLQTGEAVEVSKTEAVGCVIGRVLQSSEDTTVTFANQISRILNQHCVNCHRNGQIGPFSLIEFDEVVGWAGMIAEVVADNRMPPWHASADHGEFANDSRLSEEEKQLIARWIANGAPLGDVGQMPAPPIFDEAWQIGKPDAIITMSAEPFEVPATGTVPYKYFLVDTNFEEDKWVKAAECRPGARAVVHHIIVGLRGEGEFGRRERRQGVHDDLDSEWISATAPGAPPMILPDGYAKFIPAGAKLVFQMHYTPNGTKQHDISEIGLIFAEPHEVRKRVYTQQVHSARFEIPPGDPHYEVKARTTIQKDAELIALFPHMHFRGKSFTFQLREPGQDPVTLLHVPNYDFNWQNSYVLKQRLEIPAGSVMSGTAIFDNSAKNLANPDPTQAVRWGDQTWDEMMIGYFDIAIDIDRK